MKIDPPLPQPGDSEEEIDRKVAAWDNVEAEEAEEADDADDDISDRAGRMFKNKGADMKDELLQSGKFMLKSKANQIGSSLLDTLLNAIKNLFIR